MWGHMEFAKPDRVRHGFTPQMSYWMDKIEKEAERSRNNKSGVGFVPFTNRMKDICTLGSTRSNVPCSYIYQDKAVAQIEMAEWSNVKGSRNYLLYFTKLYVLDNQRDSGIGTEFLSKIKQIVDDTGMAMFLFASSYSFTGGDLPYAFTNVDDLLKCWEAERLLHTEADELLIQWYQRLGFFNGCIHDDNIYAAQDYHRIEQQFLYVSDKCVDADLVRNRKHAEHMCHFCKDQKDTNCTHNTV